MGGLQRHNSPTGVHSRVPKVSRVGFAGVTGISRPLSNDEHWSLYDFEAHAAQCQLCFDPLKVSKAGKQLCDKGHKLAIDVAGLIFRRSDGDVYSRVRDGAQEVRVEIPHGYDQTSSLLRAIQRSIKHGDRFIRPASHDRTYLVGPRLPTEKVKHHHKEEAQPTAKPAKTYDTIIVEPEPSSPTRTRPRRERDLQDTHSESKRGSLYGLDMGELERAEKREQKLHYNYNVEVREPSYRSRRRPATYR